MSSWPAADQMDRHRITQMKYRHDPHSLQLKGIMRDTVCSQCHAMRHASFVEGRYSFIAVPIFWRALARLGSMT